MCTKKAFYNKTDQLQCLKVHYVTLKVFKGTLCTLCNLLVVKQQNCMHFVEEHCFGCASVRMNMSLHR